ncbi:hypothetical protein C7H09_17090 [Marinobacter fuscus]|uniref:Uncharacterized protein n=1 Tax=Marinobacter fuscus TaxID=2109942 RepID=A0A2T1K4C5_9GAMM|nr:hypothetical protein [Marinobacter fuscus]PSF05016.1 hypothetical protein C7H09_17090 [Marinobacter fuscus]
MGIGTDGLKGAAKGGVYVTLVVSMSVNSYAWIFDESFGWQDFLLNVSADLVKAAISIALGYFVAKLFSLYTGAVVFANGAGFIVGLGFGVHIASIGWSDVALFAEETVRSYQKAIDAISNPSGFIDAQKHKLGDFAYCALDAAGSVVITAVQREIEAKVTDILRRLSPLNVR